MINPNTFSFGLSYFFDNIQDLNTLYQKILRAKHCCSESNFYHEVPQQFSTVSSPSLLVLRCRIQEGVYAHTFTYTWAQTLPPQDLEHLSRACAALLTTTFELAKKKVSPAALPVLQPAVTRILLSYL